MHPPGGVFCISRCTHTGEKPSMRLLDVSPVRWPICFGSSPTRAPFPGTSGHTRARSPYFPGTSGHTRASGTNGHTRASGVSALIATRNIKGENPAHAHTRSRAHTTRSNARDGRTTRERRRLTFSLTHPQQPKRVYPCGYGVEVEWDIEHALQRSPVSPANW